MKEPALCPICTGSGIVPEGFYRRTSQTWSNAGGIETCRACEGKGYILVFDDDECNFEKYSSYEYEYHYYYMPKTTG